MMNTVTKKFALMLKDRCLCRYKGFCPVLIYKNDPILNAEYVMHKDCSCSSLDHRLPWSSQVPEIYFSDGLFA